MSAIDLDAAKLVSELDALLGLGPGSAPTPEPTPSPPPLEAPRPRRAAGPARILIADDSDDYRKLVSFLLAEHGYKVFEAKSGTEGLRIAQTHKLDMALLDFDMPGFNGYELIQELRSRDETRKLPIIMITGAEKRRQLRQLGMDISDFLEKPVANQDLLTSIDRVLAGRESSPEESSPVEEPPASEAEEPALPPAPDETAGAALESFDGIEESEDLLIEERKKEEDETAGLDVLANDSPLVNRINKLLIRAVEMGASDIHIEPQEKHVIVRVRLNGCLKPLCQFPAALSPQIAARVKIMSNLIITERRRPQDGQVRAMIKGKKIEFRVSTIPSIYGEKIVMRVLGGAKIKTDLKELGFSARDLEVVVKALQTPHGLLLVTGPTGSGKTTTLYTMMKQLNEPDVNIMTAEDPIEYELAGITQVHIKPHIGLTFESVLRSFLRQDPDIMLVGEIRDLETAEIAVKAAITGHLVFSTLHTNSAAATVMRLAHMGVAPYLLADSVKLIVAQRLVRTLCKACRTPGAAPADFLKLLTPEEAALVPKIFTAPGCAACAETGYSGRMPIFEVMEVRTPEIRQLILSSQSVDKIALHAAAEGMVRLRQAALEAVASGATTASEALNIMLSE